MDKVKIILDYLKEHFPRHTHKYNPYDVLVSCVLSQRARDEVTEKVSAELLKIAPTPEKLAKLDVKEIARTIKPIGFYRQKAKRLKEIGRMLTDKKVPDSLDELIKLPGVGRKTANVVLCYGFNRDAIPVDTHVNQVSKRIGLVDKNASVYDVEKKLEELFPKEYWRLINLGFVSFGKAICKPRGPLCKKCPFNDFCKFYKENYS
ncbi:MAG: endonuclease III [Candidatus Woesearchaeota archaeon]|nr:MAG: endonuclease III [Candidatus Woesearchaeota archaeon]